MKDGYNMPRMGSRTASFLTFILESSRAIASYLFYSIHPLSYALLSIRPTSTLCSRLRFTAVLWKAYGLRCINLTGSPIPNGFASLRQLYFLSARCKVTFELRIIVRHVDHSDAPRRGMGDTLRTILTRSYRVYCVVSLDYRPSPHSALTPPPPSLLPLTPSSPPSPGPPPLPPFPLSLIHLLPLLIPPFHLPLERRIFLPHCQVKGGSLSVRFDDEDLRHGFVADLKGHRSIFNVQPRKLHAQHGVGIIAALTRVDAFNAHMALRG